MCLVIAFFNLHEDRESSFKRKTPQNCYLVYNLNVSLVMYKVESVFRLKLYNSID